MSIFARNAERKTLRHYLCINHRHMERWNETRNTLFIHQISAYGTLKRNQQCIICASVISDREKHIYKHTFWGFSYFIAENFLALFQIVWNFLINSKGNLTWLRIIFRFIVSLPLSSDGMMIEDDNYYLFMELHSINKHIDCLCLHISC